MDSPCPCIVEGGLAVDDRGQITFANDFDMTPVKRFYQVHNHNPECVRAWHGHQHEGKYVYVAQGAILVGTVSMTPAMLANAKSYMASGDSRRVAIELPWATRWVLSSAKPQLLWIPPGFFNGWQDLDCDSIVMFFSTSTLAESKGDDYRLPWDYWDCWRVTNR